MTDTSRDHAPSGLLPTDPFSLAMRNFEKNPGAVRSSSTITITDPFYGHTETWVIDTFRADGSETVLLQRIDVAGGIRMVLPPKVTAAIAAQRDRATAVNRKRGAQRAVATRIARGDTLGNPSALLKARKAKRSKRSS